MSKIVLKIRRPSGEIDLVDITGRFTIFDKSVYEKMVKLTKSNGRGEIIGLAEGMFWEEEMKLGQEEWALKHKKEEEKYSRETTWRGHDGSLKGDY